MDAVSRAFASKPLLVLVSHTIADRVESDIHAERQFSTPAVGLET